MYVKSSDLRKILLRKFVTQLRLPGNKGFFTFSRKTGDIFTNDFSIYPIIRLEHFFSPVKGVIFNVPFKNSKKTDKCHLSIHQIKIWILKKKWVIETIVLKFLEFRSYECLNKISWWDKVSNTYEFGFEINKVLKMGSFTKIC